MLGAAHISNRIATLHHVNATTAIAATVSDVCEAFADTFNSRMEDIPFSILYLVDEKDDKTLVRLRSDYL